MNCQAANMRVEKLVMRYGRRTVIDDLSLALPSGRVTAIVGPNGCGKSTLLSGLARLHKPAAGHIYLDDFPINSFSSRTFARQLALLPQQVNAPQGLTVSELVQFGRQPHQSWFRQWSPEDQHVVDAVLQAADLVALADRPLEAMSGGQRQRAWLAMTIAQQTRVVLLDEPTTALDIGHAVEIFERIRQLAGQHRTVVMVVHDLINACRYADYLVAMKEGRILAAGRPADVVTSDLIRALYRVDCELQKDPATQAPIMVNIRRVR